MSRGPEREKKKRKKRKRNKKQEKERRKRKKKVKRERKKNFFFSFIYPDGGPPDIFPPLRTQYPNQKNANHQTIFKI